MTINWGIIGPGSIAHTFADALQQSEKGQLLAVASRDQERGQQFAQRYQAKTVYSDYQQLMNDDNVDIIYIATPHSHHFPLAKQVLAAGKHLLLEKPLTVNAKQTQILVDLSNQHQVVFQEALWSRFMPCYAKVKAWLATNEIGELQYITSQIGFDFSTRGLDHRLNRADLAGGAILDLGVYSTSISQFLLSENPDKVQAMANINAQNVDQNTLVNLHYPSGVFSQFTCTTRAECSNVMTLHGSKGSIEIPALFWVGEAAKLIKEGQIIENLSFAHQVNGFEYQIEATMALIEQRHLCDQRMNHADSIAVMQTLDEIRLQIGLQFDQQIESP